MIKSVAGDLGGVCITIEGGTLKEGESLVCRINIETTAEMYVFDFALLCRGAYTE